MAATKQSCPTVGLHELSDESGASQRAEVVAVKTLSDTRGAERDRRPPLHFFLL